MKGLVSVIIPTFGRPELLLRAIQSVLTQSYHKIEILVIDDNGFGTENQLLTSQAVAHLQNKPDFYYIVLPHNVGGAIARNRGVEHASGEFITFLDDDDEYHKDKILIQKNFYQNLEQTNNYLLKCQLAVRTDGQLLRITSDHVSQNTMLFDLLNDKVIGTPSLFLKRELFVTAGGFPDVAKGQEWLLVMRLFHAGAEIITTDDILVDVHVQRNDSISNGYGDKKRLLKNGKEIFEIKRKYFDKLSPQQVKFLMSKQLFWEAEVHASNRSILAVVCLIKALIVNPFDSRSVTTLFRCVAKALIAR